MALTKKEQELLAQAVKEPSILKSANKKVLENEEFFLEAAVINPAVLKYTELTYQFYLSDKLEELIAKNGMVYRYLPSYIKNDVNIALLAIESTSDIIPYILKTPQEDINKLHINGKIKITKNMALYFAQTYLEISSNDIKGFENDRDVIWAAVKKSTHNIRVAEHDFLTKNVDILKFVYKETPTIFTLAPMKQYLDLFIHDRDFYIEAIKESDSPILEPQYASDEEIVKLVMQKAPDNYPIIAPRFLEKKEYVKMAVAYDGELLKYVPHQFHDDRELVKLAVSNNGIALEFASDRLKNDVKIVELAAKDNYEAVKFASEELRDNEKLMKKLVSKDGCVLEYASNRIRTNKDIVRIAIDNDCEAIRHVAFPLCIDDDFVIEEVLKNPCVATYLCDSLKDDANFFMDLIEQYANTTDDFYLLYYLPKEIQDNPMIVAACVEQNIEEFKYASEQLQNNVDFIYTLIATLQLDIWCYLSPQMKKNSEIKKIYKKIFHK